MRREPGARECNGYSADEEMDGSASREAEEPRALGSANGIGAKYRRAQDSGGGGGNGYHRPMGRGPGGDGSYYRPAARVPGGEGAYYRPMWRTPGLEGKTRSANHLHRGERRGFGREFGRRFERRPGDGAMNGYAGGSRRWKPRPGGREYAGGLGARIREDEGGRESPASQDEGEGNRGAGEEEEGEQAVEERWTLFKPPAAFPVDSSTARTVPRISYASKVKENLSRTGPLAPESGGGASDDSSGSEGGPRRSPGPAHSLGAIFHNQWGLSFITEPSPGRESSETHGRTGLNSQPPDPGPGHPGGLGPGCFPVNRLSPSCERWSASHTLDLQAVVLYFSTEWDRIWDRHKRDPSAVVLYEESLDSAGLTD